MAFLSAGIMDNMIQMLERYADNLENIVDQRTSELLEEKKKTDRLLYNMLPRYVRYFNTYTTPCLIVNSVIPKSLDTSWVNIFQRAKCKLQG